MILTSCWSVKLRYRVERPDQILPPQDCDLCEQEIHAPCPVPLFKIMSDYFINEDDYHYTTRKIDSYNKTDNFIISPREAGKTTYCYKYKAFLPFKYYGAPFINVRTMTADITDVWLDSIAGTINKFLPDDQHIRFKYKHSAIKDGILDVYVDGKIFMRTIALKIPANRFKSLYLSKPSCIIEDEFIKNMEWGESYLPNQALKFKELYKTFSRECDKPLKAYHCGNPYSHYNPYFSFHKIDYSKLRAGSFIADKTYAIECYQISQELKDHILARDPDYQFDDSYKRYAFDGEAINDANIPLMKNQLPCYKLKHLFKVNDVILGVYINFEINPHPRFWVGKISKFSLDRNLYIFDFNKISQNTLLIDSRDRLTFESLKLSIKRNNVGYQDIECYYLTEEIYNKIQEESSWQHVI